MKLAGNILCCQGRLAGIKPYMPIGHDQPHMTIKVLYLHVIDMNEKSSLFVVQAAAIQDALKMRGNNEKEAFCFASIQ